MRVRERFFDLVHFDVTHFLIVKLLVFFGLDRRLVIEGLLRHFFSYVLGRLLETLDMRLKFELALIMDGF